MLKCCWYSSNYTYLLFEATVPTVTYSPLAIARHSCWTFARAEIKAIADVCCALFGITRRRNFWRNRKRQLWLIYLEELRKEGRPIDMLLAHTERKVMKVSSGKRTYKTVNYWFYGTWTFVYVSGYVCANRCPRIQSHVPATLLYQARSCAH